jgi:hypothetical protein
MVNIVSDLLNPTQFYLGHDLSQSGLFYFIFVNRQQPRYR